MQHLQPKTTLQGGKYRIERVLGQEDFDDTKRKSELEFDYCHNGSFSQPRGKPMAAVSISG